MFPGNTTRGWVGVATLTGEATRIGDGTLGTTPFTGTTGMKRLGAR